MIDRRRRLPPEARASNDPWEDCRRPPRPVIPYSSNSERGECQAMTTESGDLYDRMGEAYAAHADASPYNALYDRPAILALAGDVRGQRVLDVGCAAGALSAELAERGADVLGIDVSQTMLRLAERRMGARARFRVADIARPLDFLATSSIDLVAASLVMHYLLDWVPTLREFRRVLSPGGRMVFSTHHPAEDWRWFRRPSYFAIEEIVDRFPLGGHTAEVRFYRRPLSAIFSAIRESGFQVDDLVEPMPLPECAERYPVSYASLTKTPRFLYFRLRPGASTA
jgi:SAM-dependent methyltransferase